MLVRNDLPSFAGCTDSLRGFWASFTSLKLLPLLKREGKTGADDEDLADELQRRCMEASLPFSLATRLLTFHWPRRPGEDAARWDTLLAVQRLIGRLDEIKQPARSGLVSTMSLMRDAYLEQARAFLFIAAELDYAWNAKKIRNPRKLDPKHGVIKAKVGALVVAQSSVPPAWRNPPSRNAVVPYDKELMEKESRRREGCGLICG